MKKTSLLAVCICAALAFGSITTACGTKNNNEGDKVDNNCTIK